MLQVQLSNLESPYANRPKQNTLSNVNNGKYLIRDIKDLTPSEQIIFIKIGERFKFNEVTHIVDFTRLSNGLSRVTDQKLREFAVGLVETFASNKDVITKNGDKLYFICPTTLGEYCPVCSFISAMNNISNVPALSLCGKPEIINNDSNDYIEATKFLSSFSALVELLSENVYTITNYFMPAVIYNDSNMQANNNIIRMGKKDLVTVSSAVKDYSEDIGFDLQEISDFTGIFNTTQDGLVSKVIDVERTRCTPEIHSIVTPIFNEVSSWTACQIETKLFGYKSSQVGNIQGTFEGIFNEICEHLINQVEKIALNENICELN